jgi:HEAT repeat protein
MVNATKSQSKLVRLAAVNSIGAIGSSSELRNITSVLLNSKDKEELDVAEEAINSICGKIQNKEQASSILIESYPKATVESKVRIIKITRSNPI